MAQRNYYALLGVKRTASLSEIRSAYVQRIKNAHPDLHRPETYPKAPVEELQRAYQCLRNADTRSAHDAELHAAEMALHSRLRHRQRRLVAKVPNKRGATRYRPRPSNQDITSRWRRILLTSSLILIAIVLVKHS